MLDKIQFLLSLQIIGFCIFGGVTLLLRAGDNRAKRILGWGMFLWAFLAAIRLSVNLYLHKPKEAFHPDILIMGALVTATLACYVIEVLRPWFLTCKRFFLFISPVVFGGLAYLTYRLSGGEIHTYYSIREVFEYLNMDVLLRMTVFLLTLFYMILPVYLDRDITVIGKLETAADAVINMPTVSRIHAKIRKRDGEYYLTDLNSRNGTSVNGQILKNGEDRLLEDEDEVDFAQARYIFLK